MTVGKYALVTGASSGIGWFISHELAERGYAILAVSDQKEDLEKLVGILKSKYKVNAMYLYIDLSDPDAAEKVHDFCRSNQLYIEVVVNNAGIMINGPLEWAHPFHVRRILNLHMVTATMLSHYFGKQMALRKSGYILNVSSISSKMPYPTLSLYGSTKSYLRFFTRAFRSEMRPYGVRVTCLIPGATVTALYDTARIPTKKLKRFGIMKEPGPVAKAGIEALFKNRAECIPGIFNKLVLTFAPLIPRKIIDLLYLRKFKTLTVDHNQ